MTAILNGERIVLGTCYYPEHWSETLWESDFQRMLANGIEVVRIAEFAWSKVELTEGDFNFDFFDGFMDVVEKMGMKVIFCTPTATPPAWLTNKYPEVLNATMDGVLYRHGARRHYNYNSPKYKELSAIITEKFASHYAPHPNIIGWQIDNEINCEKNVFYSESDTLAFREFLKQKYDCVEALNKAWGTTFWNQTYTAWEEIFVPRTTLSDATNPHQVLDYTRFVSDSACRFAKMQADIIRKYIKPDDFVTTNGLFGNLDNHRMNKESLDFMTYDSYPNFAYMLGGDFTGESKLKDRKWSRNLTEVRSVSKAFGIMEQQSGANGWNTGMEAPTPRPGQLSLWTMQSIAHGADFISYFRWRTCTMGTEIYWHGILDYSSRDTKRLKEVNDVHEKLKKMKDIAGAQYAAKVGIIKDYDNVWDAQLDVWHKHLEQRSHAALFEAAQLSHTPVDYIYLTEDASHEDLKGYEVLFYPHATIMTKERAQLLEDYTVEGGTLVFGCRSGYKDLTGKCVMDKLPGLLQPLSGTDIPEYSMIPPDVDKIEIDWDGTILKAEVFTEILEAQGSQAKIVGTYTNEDYAGEGALVCNKFGEGTVYYYGAAFNQESARVFLEKLKVISPFTDIVEAPETCEIAVRKKADKKYLFVLNYMKEPAEILLKQEGTDLYTGEKVMGRCTLPKYGTMVVELQ